MSIVNLAGHVPVTVRFDTEENKIVRVIVWDEEQEWDATGNTDDDDGRTLTPNEASTFQAIADSLEWPAWEFGW